MDVNENIIKLAHERKDNIILHGYRGSITHGLNVEGKSDIDTMGIFMGGIEDYFGLPKNDRRGTVEISHDKYDIVLYDVRKMFSLLLRANPNVLSLLWLDEEYYLEITEYGRMIIDNRDIFSSKLAFSSFTGYADGQLKRMESGGKNHRMGDKRKRLVDEFGYDTKNAAHLIRLLRMGIEFLKDGQLRVWRKDRDELLAIKRGAWSLDRIKGEAGVLFKEAHEAKLKSPLPDEPDYEKAEELLIEILEHKHFSGWLRSLKKIKVGGVSGK